MDKANHVGIASRLRAARHRAGLSREALAVHSGISWSAIAQIENGRRTNLRPSTLSALAGTLGVTIDYLVSGAGPARPMFEHRVLLYETEDDFLATAVPFLSEGLERSEAAIAVTSRALIRRLRRRLGPRASEVRFAESSRWYRHPAETLRAYRSFMERSVEAGATWVRILGEPAWKGRTDTELQQWARYESLMNLAFSREPVSALCPYSIRDLDPAVIEHARATHPHIIDHDGLHPNEHYIEPDGYLLEARPAQRTGSVS